VLVTFSNPHYVLVYVRIRKIVKSDFFSFVMSVRPSVSLSAQNNSDPTGRIFMKFEIPGCFENMSPKFKFR